MSYEEFKEEGVLKAECERGLRFFLTPGSRIAENYLAVDEAFEGVLGEESMRAEGGLDEWARALEHVTADESFKEFESWQNGIGWHSQWALR